VITRAYEQAELWVQVSVGFADWTLIVHGLDGDSMTTVNRRVFGCERERERKGD
jgi:hypothetical protein